MGKTTKKMQNETGETVDLYIPRKCSYTMRLITAKDHGSVQINVANIDPITGTSKGDSKTYALCGYIRAKAEGDMALSYLVEQHDTQSMAAAAAAAVASDSNCADLILFFNDYVFRLISFFFYLILVLLVNILKL